MPKQLTQNAIGNNQNINEIKQQVKAEFQKEASKKIKKGIPTIKQVLEDKSNNPQNLELRDLLSRIINKFAPNLSEEVIKSILESQEASVSQIKNLVGAHSQEKLTGNAGGDKLEKQETTQKGAEKIPTILPKALEEFFQNSGELKGKLMSELMQFTESHNKDDLYIGLNEVENDPAEKGYVQDCLLFLKGKKEKLLGKQKEQKGIQKKETNIQKKETNIQKKETNIQKKETNIQKDKVLGAEKDKNSAELLKRARKNQMKLSDIDGIIADSANLKTQSPELKRLIKSLKQIKSTANSVENTEGISGNEQSALRTIMRNTPFNTKAQGRRNIFLGVIQKVSSSTEFSEDSKRKIMSSFNVTYGTHKTPSTAKGLSDSIKEGRTKTTEKMVEKQVWDEEKQKMVTKFVKEESTERVPYTEDDPIVLDNGIKAYDDPANKDNMVVSVKGLNGATLKMKIPHNTTTAQLRKYVNYLQLAGAMGETGNMQSTIFKNLTVLDGGGGMINAKTQSDIDLASDMLKNMGMGATLHLSILSKAKLERVKERLEYFRSPNFSGDGNQMSDEKSIQAGFKELGIVGDNNRMDKNKFLRALWFISHYSGLKSGVESKGDSKSTKSEPKTKFSALKEFMLQEFGDKSEKK